MKVVNVINTAVKMLSEIKLYRTYEYEIFTDGEIV